MTIGEKLFASLLLAYIATFVGSFFYMLKKRGMISALFWSLVPHQLLLSWASSTELDENPPWLDRLQFGIIAAMLVLWIMQKMSFL